MRDLECEAIMVKFNGSGPTTRTSMIYLNNAGTTWPKPSAVTKAIQDFNECLPDQWLDTFRQGEEIAISFFGIPDRKRFMFTQSCTQSLSIAFSDFPWEPGDRLLISSMEHHALSRWFYKLQNERKIEGVLIPRSTTGPFDLDAFEQELRKGARMAAISMASNVTGEILPFEDIVRLCKDYEVVCLLDGAQTAGLMPIDLTELDPDIFVFAGHKGPFGPQGIGGLYISERVSMVCPSAACEVTPGAKTPAIFPTYCDAGSAPMGAIAGMSAGLIWLKDSGWQALTEHRTMLIKQLREGLQGIEGIEVAGSVFHDRYTGAVSITTPRIPLSQVNDTLWKDQRIKGSYGFQCAPLAHEAIGTQESGTLRFSPGPMNTAEEIAQLLESLKNIMR